MIKRIARLVLSAIITGMFTGTLIFGFRLAAGFAITFSDKMYVAIRQNPLYLIIGVLGVVCLGLTAAFILKKSPSCKGGGTVTAIGVLKGIVSCSWIKNIFLLFPSAIITFFGGVPLGNEGPSVLMGTAVGSGVSRLFKAKDLEIEIMSGGAAAGFGTATASPVSAVCFVFEEIHKKINVWVLLPVLIGVLSSTITSRWLFFLCGKDYRLFNFTLTEVLPDIYFLLAVLIGIISALAAAVFIKLFKVIDRFVNEKLSKIHFFIKIVSVFVLTFLLGFLSKEFIGSGHDLIEVIIHGKAPIYYMCLVFLVVRVGVLLLANRAGVCGGLFVPSLTFGALLGTIIAQIANKAGLLDEKYMSIIVVIAMASYLAASFKIPVTAVIFAIEALRGFNNIIPIIIGVSVAYFATKIFKIQDFTHIAIEKLVDKEKTTVQN